MAGFVPLDGLSFSLANAITISVAKEKEEDAVIGLGTDLNIHHL